MIIFLTISVSPVKIFILLLCNQNILPLQIFLSSLCYVTYLNISIIYKFQILTLHIWELYKNYRLMENISSI